MHAGGSTPAFQVVARRRRGRVRDREPDRRRGKLADRRHPARAGRTRTSTSSWAASSRSSTTTPRSKRAPACCSSTWKTATCRTLTSFASACAATAARRSATTARSPTRRTHDRAGGNGDHVQRTLRDSDTASLAVLRNRPSEGTWTLHASDHEGAGIGKLNRWSLTIH
ncbi:MAG TPA: proprotein convertase P-domain-containing protein [Planctomycetota bacterium]|nr:proprotein convertase P-domain-containing protein [Planctomycetota bacterium]